jgi:hypothetical protein
MRKSAVKIFTIGFLKSLFFIALFFAISMTSYKLIMHFYGIGNANAIETIPSVQKQTSITKSSIDDVSKQLIYSVDDETGAIEKLLLEIFDCEEQMLYYITIPIKTQLTLSNSLHRELVLVKPSIPQFLKFSAITGYFPKETAYEYGVLMIEDLLNIQISYYTVVPQSIYEAVFQTEVINQQANNRQESDDLFPREVFSDGFLEHLHTINTETGLRSYIEEFYTQIISNLTLNDKLNYMEGYLNVSGKNISFEVIAGKDSNSAFTIDETMATKQLGTFLGE